MRDLIVSIFRNKSQAEQARRELLDRDRDGVFGLEDAVTVEKTQSGRLKFHHMTYFTLGGAFGGAFLGALAGALFLNPVFVFGGLLIGLVTGLVCGFAAPIGINPDQVKSQASNLDPGQAALYVQPGDNPARVAETINNSATIETRICTLSERELQCKPWDRAQTSDAMPTEGNGTRI